MLCSKKNEENQLWNEMKFQRNEYVFFFWLEKRNDIWTNVTQIVCKARAKRDREREGGVRVERERVIGTGW